MPTTPEDFEAMRQRTEAAIARGKVKRVVIDPTTPSEGPLPPPVAKAVDKYWQAAKGKGLVEGVSQERKLHDAIIAECKQRGWIYFHGSMAHRAMRTLGEPDFSVLADRGRVFFVECKTKTGKLSPEQLALKVWAEKLEHTIHTVRSLAEFLEIVK